mmetsp:Transcript_25526/g.58949  ORF Transcript_25526/g.58949 Transcript_25526/m.58949 type:complete len:220 (+) Transcript_25526:336-995(+)
MYAVPSEGGLWKMIPSAHGRCLGTVWTKPSTLCHDVGTPCSQRSELLHRAMHTSSRCWQSRAYPCPIKWRPFWPLERCALEDLLPLQNHWDTRHCEKQNEPQNSATLSKLICFHLLNWRMRKYLTPLPLEGISGYFIRGICKEGLAVIDCRGHPTIAITRSGVMAFHKDNTSAKSMAPHGVQAMHCTGYFLKIAELVIWIHQGLIEPNEVSHIPLEVEA